MFKTKETKSLGSSFRLAPKAETNSSTANGSTVALRGWPRRLEAPFSGQGSSAGLYGLGNGFGFGIRNLRFSMGSPQTEAAEWNCSASIGLRSETRTQGVPVFRQNTSFAPKWGLRRSKLSGSISVARHLIFPGLPGHRPALKAGLRVLGV